MSKNDIGVVKYDRPNYPSYDVKATFQHMNPFYYPVVEIPKHKSRVSMDQTTLHSRTVSSISTPMQKETSGSYIESIADAGAVEDQASSANDSNLNPLKKKIFQGQLKPRKSFMHNDIIKQGEHHLRRMQSGMNKNGENLDNWDWKGKDPSVFSIQKSVHKKKEKKPKINLNAKASKVKVEELRENRLPYHDYTFKPKFLVVTKTKPFSNNKHFKFVY